MGPNDEVAELSCNIDDMTGEALGYAFRALLDEGAYDVYTTAIDMKKDRPGTMLSVICPEKKADHFAALILKYTSSFGVRKTLHQRYIMDRKIEEIETPLGKVRLKSGEGYGIKKSKLEYEDLAELAKLHNVPVMEIERQIWAYMGRPKE